MSGAYMTTISNRVVSAVDPLLKPQNESFLNDQIVSRLREAILIPFVMLSAPIDMIVGLGYYAGSILTFGTEPKLFSYANKFTLASGKLFSTSYLHLLKVFIPKAGTDKKIKEFNGLFTHNVYQKIEEKAQHYSSSKNIFVRHGASRFTYPLLAIACVITRIADLVVGIFAAALSFIPYFGAKTWLNDSAFRGLEVLNIVNDLFYCTVKCFYPWAGITNKLKDKKPEQQTAAKVEQKERKPKTAANTENTGNSPKNRTNLSWV